MVPPTPLLTSDVLKEENEQWPDVQQGMSLALREMRVDQVSTGVPLIPAGHVTRTQGDEG